MYQQQFFSLQFNPFGNERFNLSIEQLNCKIQFPNDFLLKALKYVRLFYFLQNKPRKNV
jgi:hypothetical protein